MSYSEGNNGTNFTMPVQPYGGNGGWGFDDPQRRYARLNRIERALGKFLRALFSSKQEVRAMTYAKQ